MTLSPSAKVSPVSWVRLTLDVSMIGLSLVALFVALDYHRLARYLPVLAASIAFLAATITFVRDLRRLHRFGTVLERYLASPAPQQTEEDGSPTDEGTESKLALAARRYIAWTVGCCAAVVFLGLYPSVVIFLTAFLRTEARASWRFIVTGVVGTMAIIYGFSQIIDVRWPSGLFW
jgi:hypothetical protein